MSNSKVPPVSAEPDWSPVVPFPGAGTARTFVSGDQDADRLRIQYFRRESDGALVGRAWFGSGAEGPPGYAHGGALAAVLDEAMGAAAWMAGHPAVAARIVVDFRDMLPIGTDATFEATVLSVEGRKVQTRARLTGHDGRLYGESEGLFIILEAARLEQFGKT